MNTALLFEKKWLSLSDLSMKELRLFIIAATQKVYTEEPKKSAQVFYWKIKILYLPTPSFWSKRVKL